MEETERVTLKKYLTYNGSKENTRERERCKNSGTVKHHLKRRL